LAIYYILQVRFFERVKLERRIKRLQKHLQGLRSSGQEVPKADLERLALLQDDLQVAPIMILVPFFLALRLVNVDTGMMLAPEERHASNT
jgi:hypothetical protein